jgi:catecholate siderophore receptor
LAAAIISVLSSAAAQSAGAPAKELGKISVGAEDDSYKSDAASSPKFSQPLRDTPQTITVITSSVIKEQAATTLRDVLRNSPGITFQAGEGGGGLPGDQNFSMRGFSARNSLFIDGVRDSGAYARDSFNLESVEVIKGPSGSISGRSASSGAINQVAKTPHAGDSQDYSLAFGSDAYKRVTADTNMELNDSLGLRLNAMYHDAEVSNRDVVENKRWGIAPSFALNFSEATRLTLGLFYLEEDNVPDYGLPWSAYEAGVDQSIFYGLKNYDYEDIESKSATVQLEHVFNEAVSIRNLARYLETDRDSAITAPRPPNRQLQRRATSNENITNLTDLTFAFTSGAIEHTLVSGLELSSEKTTNRNSAQTTNQPQVIDFFNPDPNERPLGPMPPNLGNPGPSETQADTVALYVFDTIALTNQWLLSAGLRWDHVDIDFEQLTLATGVRSELSKTEEDVNYQAGITFKPLENGSIYLSYGTSFDPTVDAGSTGPGLSDSPTAANNINLDPEESSNFELGTKWDVFGERLSLTAAVFRMEKTNVRTRLTNGDPYVLDGKQRVDGVELSATGAVTDAWSIFAGAAYLDSEYKSSANTLEEGRELVLVPDFSFNAWSTYVLPFGLTVGLGAQYTDDVVRNRTATGENTVDGHWLIDAMASYDVTNSIGLRLNLTNLADEEYVDRVGGGHYVPGAGRTVSLTANFSF